MEREASPLPTSLSQAVDGPLMIVHSTSRLLDCSAAIDSWDWLDPTMATQQEGGLTRCLFLFTMFLNVSLGSKPIHDQLRCPNVPLHDYSKEKNKKPFFSRDVAAGLVR